MVDSFYFNLEVSFVDPSFVQARTNARAELQRSCQEAVRRYVAAAHTTADLSATELIAPKAGTASGPAR